MDKEREGAMDGSLVGVVTGGAIGLVSGIVGVCVGQILTSRREARSRTLDGLRSVIDELNRLKRLALQFEQMINVGLQRTSVESFATNVFSVPGWLEATHELTERRWEFSCMAYLPEALKGFEKTDRLIATIMDPYQEKPRTAEHRSRAEAWKEFLRTYDEVWGLAERRLRMFT